jgi:WD40 repeat protein
MRNEAITALSLTDLKLHHKMNFISRGGQVDPSLKWLASVEPGFYVSIRNTEGSEVLRVPPSPDGPWHVTTEFSPCGQWVLIQYWFQRGDPLLNVWHVASQQHVYSQRVSSGLVFIAAAFHPNQRWLITCLPNRELCVWDVPERREVKRIPLGFSPFSICVDSRGHRVAANSNAGDVVKIVDVESGRELAAWRDRVGGWAMDWSSDDELLAVADVGTVFVWNVPRAEVVSVLRGHSAGVIRARFARGNHLLATTGWEFTSRLWDVIAGESLVMTDGLVLQFSKDNLQLATMQDGRVSIWDVAPALERRVLHPRMIGNRTDRRENGGVLAGAYGLDGRILATGVPGFGISIRDAGSLAHLAHLELGWCQRVLFHPHNTWFLTVGVDGLLGWPMQLDTGTDSDVLRIGPPRLLQELPPIPETYDITWLPGHEAVVVSDPPNGRVLILDMPQQADATVSAVPRSSIDGAMEPLTSETRLEDGAARVLTSEHRRATGIDASADGRWVAAGGWKERGVQIWNTATGKLEHVLPPSDYNDDDISFWVRFSPDNRWLVCMACGGSGQSIGNYFWRVGTWEKAYFVRNTGTAGVAFSADGQRMALSVNSDEIMLADPADGRELLRLSTLPTLRAAPVCFDPSGTRLVAQATPDVVLIWDLTLLRAGLAELGLEWDDPTPPINTQRSANKPLRVVVDSGDLLAQLEKRRRHQQAGEHAARAREHERTRRWKDAFAERERAIALNPADSFSHNNLAWFLATCPERELRDIPRALEIAKRAVELAPENPNNRNTAGVCFYRAGDWHPAIRELTEAERLAPGKWFAHNALFLAMAHWQLNERDTARLWFDQAVQWLEQNKGSYDDELKRFRAEAATLLGLAEIGSDT